MAELEGVTVGIHPETTEEESPKEEGTKTTAKKKKGPPEVLYSINSKYGKIPVYKTEEEPCKLKRGRGTHTTVAQTSRNDVAEI